MKVIQFSSLTFLLGALALLSSAASEAKDSQLWTIGSITVKLSDKWNLSQDLTARFSSDRHGLYELETNILVGRQLAKTVTLWAGYDHDPQYSAGRFSVMEHRFVQQVALGNLARVAGGQISGRVRLEQRWRDGKNGTAWRLRPYARYNLPLSGHSKTSLAVSEESFIDLNTTSFQKVSNLERLRTFIGISTPLAKNLNADLGYLNQYGFVPHAKDTSDNVAYASVSLKL